MMVLEKSNQYAINRSCDIESRDEHNCENPITENKVKLGQKKIRITEVIFGFSLVNKLRHNIFIKG